MALYFINLILYLNNLIKKKKSTREADGFFLFDDIFHKDVLQQKRHSLKTRAADIYRGSGKFYYIIAHTKLLFN